MQTIPCILLHYLRFHPICESKFACWLYRQTRVCKSHRHSL